MILRRQHTVLVCAVLLLMASVVRAAPTPDQPPIPGAVRVISVGPDNSTGTDGVIGGVVQPWLSNHNVLHFRHGVLFRYDENSRTDTRLTDLTRQVMSSHCYLYFLDASPDGQQVVWGMSANGPLFVATVDGTRRAEWDGDGGMTEPHWCADGKHWMQFHFDGTPTSLHWTRIQMHGLDTPTASETFSSPPPGLNGLDILAAPSADRVIARTPDPMKFGASKPTGGKPQADGTFSLTFTDTPTFRTVQTISVWSLHQPQPLHRYVVALPGKAMEVSVSPNGRRVAWLLTDEAGQSLWVSGLDGGGMHRVGVVRASRSTVNGRMPNFVSGLQWVPGDQRVSFLYGDALWTVPAR
jgi:hypothetical protein